MPYDGAVIHSNLFKKGADKDAWDQFLERFVECVRERPLTTNWRWRQIPTLVDDTDFGSDHAQIRVIGRVNFKL